METWSVYKHTCPDGRVYIGITSLSPERRWNGGLGYQGSNFEFFKYILSVGWKNIVHEIMYSGLSESDARRIERDEIVKSGERVFNKVSAPRVMRAIPDDTKTEYASLREIERYCIDLWCEVYFGEVTDTNRYLVITRPGYGGWQRTVRELSSGDSIRIEREMKFIESRRRKYYESPKKK